MNALLRLRFAAKFPGIGKPDFSIRQTTNAEKGKRTAGDRGTTCSDGSGDVKPSSVELVAKAI
jgi:hypothetical protein